MPEQTPRTLNHFSLYAFTDAYWSLDQEKKASFHKNWLTGLRSAARTVDILQNTDSKADVLVWCALEAEDKCNASTFFEKLAQATTPYRQFIHPVDSLWGFTRPSQYTEFASAQEIDPFADAHALSCHIPVCQNGVVSDQPRTAPGHDERAYPHRQAVRRY